MEMHDAYHDNLNTLNDLNHPTEKYNSDHIHNGQNEVEHMSTNDEIEHSNENNVHRNDLGLNEVNYLNNANQNDIVLPQNANDDVHENMRSHYCANCKRHHTVNEESDTMYRLLYDVLITEKSIKSTSLRRKFSTLSMNDKYTLFTLLPDKCISIYLCSQCYTYFTLPTSSNDDITKYIWPSLFWKILSSNKLYKLHKTNVWTLVPIQWRRWWFQSITTLLPEEWYVGKQINDMDSSIVDVTLKKDSLEKSIANGVLGEIMYNCDTNLLPLIKCPWGCTEFFHVCGELPIQDIFWRYLNQNAMEKMLSPIERKHATAVTIGSRNDYISMDEKFSTEFFLYNPQWRVAPSIYFKNNMPVFLTCRNHNKGCRKFYLHPPQNPFGVLPARSSDQVSPAVVVPRTIRVTKAHKYSHTFNMEEMRCQFNGVDTMSVTDKPVFNNDSILSQLYESIAIKGRSDIKAYVSTMTKANTHLADNISESLLTRADDIIQDNSHYLHNYGNGTTFISVKDAMHLQQSIKKGAIKTVSITKQNGTKYNIHYTPKWPSSIFYVHVADLYGSPFPSIPKPSRKHIIDTQILWLVAGIHICVQEVWQGTTANVTTATNEWNGWFLLYITELCFPHLLKNTRQSVFSWNGCKTKHDKEIKLLEEMKVIKKTNEVVLLNETNQEINIVQQQESNAYAQINLSGDINLPESDDIFSYENITQNEIDNSTLEENYDIYNLLEEDSEDDNTEEMEDVVETNDVHNNIYNVPNEIEVTILNRNNNEHQIEVTNNEDPTALNYNNNVSAGNDTNENRKADIVSSINAKLISDIFLKEEQMIVIKKNQIWYDAVNDRNVNIILFLNEDSIIEETNTDHTDNVLYYGFIPNDIIQNNNWELRFLYFAIDGTSIGVNRWKANVYARRGKKCLQTGGKFHLKVNL
jgi:hypothetical protein